MNGRRDLPTMGALFHLGQGAKCGSPWITKAPNLTTIVSSDGVSTV